MLEDLYKYDGREFHTHNGVEKCWSIIGREYLKRVINL